MLPVFSASSGHSAELWSGPIPPQLLNIDLIVCFCDGHIHHRQEWSIPAWQALSLHYFQCMTYGQTLNSKNTVHWCSRVTASSVKCRAHLWTQGYFYRALPDISTTSICHFGVALKQNVTYAPQRERGFNGSLYAISNGLCFISHSDDFRPCNGAVPYLVYDQWQYISVLSFGTALLHLLVLAVEFSAVQFEQQRLLLQSFIVIFTEVQLCRGISHRTSSNKWKENNAVISGKLMMRIIMWREEKFCLWMTYVSVFLLWIFTLSSL